MRSIFISYRRNDTEGEAGRLFDDLVSEFGENSVFMDVAAIEAGRDFRKVIDESVSTCGVLLAIIGKNWVDAKDDDGHRRLEDPSDFVRLETASALRRDIPSSRCWCAAPRCRVPKICPTIYAISLIAIASS